MGKYFVKDSYKENVENQYYDDTLSDNVIWQPDVYRYAIEYAKKHGINNIIDIGSGNGDKLYDYRDDFNITFIDFGANLDIIKGKFNGSNGDHSYINQDFEDSFPALPKKIIKNSVVICSDVIEHIRDMDNLGDALASYSKITRLLIVSTPDRERLYGYDHDGKPTNPFHVREWKISELESYFKSKSMDFLIGLTRTNDHTNQRSTQCVISGVDIANKDNLKKSKILNPNFLIKVISRNDLITILKENNIKPPKFDDKFCGLYNPYRNNFMLNHFLEAVSSGSTYSINKFKFIDQQSYYNTVGSTNIDTMIMQFLGSIEGDYPVSFTYLYEGDLLSPDDKSGLLTLSAQHLATHYLPEMLLGFSHLDIENEVASRIPNYANIQNIQDELASHMSVRRSTKLLAGNIKRRIIRK